MFAVWIPSDSPRANDACPLDGEPTTPPGPNYLNGTWPWNDTWASTTHLAYVSMYTWNSQAGDEPDATVIAAIADLAFSFLATAESSAAPCSAPSGGGADNGGTESSGPSEIGPTVTAAPAAGTTPGGGGVNPAIVGLIAAGAAVVLGAGILMRRRPPTPATAAPMPIAPTPPNWPGPPAASEPPTEIAALTADWFGGSEDMPDYSHLGSKAAPFNQRAYEAPIGAQTREAWEQSQRQRRLDLLNPPPPPPPRPPNPGPPV